MAQKVQTILVDDISGKEIPAGQGETIGFAVNGTQYSIDLDDKSAKKFYEALSFYVDHATKVGRSSTARAGRRRSSSDVDPAAVRAWAKSNKIKVNPRGRIAADVIEQFRAAGN